MCFDEGRDEIERTIWGEREIGRREQNVRLDCSEKSTSCFGEENSAEARTLTKT